ncbi:MAG: hypothetical protein HC902_06765 [Calothrix sp. SM1_5_4]|nr:hypothetical protein [Calothrix sp. SM1_5_4]
MNWNPHLATGFNANVPEYQLITYRGVRVPAVFQTAVNAVSGTRPMSALLDNMAVIRGYNSLTDGHDVNTGLQNFPDASTPSLSGISADHRSDLVPAVGANFLNLPFKSKRGLSLSIVKDHNGTTGGSINGLMKMFKVSSTTKQGLLGLDQVRDVVDLLHEAANAQATADSGRSAAMKDQLKNARALAMLAAEDLVSQWNTLYNKYLAIAQGTFRATGSAAGFGESPIFMDPTESLDFNLRGNIQTTYDLRESLNSAMPGANMIRSFALAEYCLKKGVSGSLLLGWGDNVNNISLRLGTDTTPTVLGVGNDQHNVPARMGTLMNAAYYRGLGTCLLELIDSLKATNVNGKSLFDSTVIHLTGDFSRSPRFDKVGTDHGWNAQVTSVSRESLMVRFVVGNISAVKTGGYRGLWGLAANVDFNGAKEMLSPRHVGAAVANLIGGVNPGSLPIVSGNLTRRASWKPRLEQKSYDGTSTKDLFNIRRRPDRRGMFASAGGAHHTREG